MMDPVHTASGSACPARLSVGPEVIGYVRCQLVLKRLAGLSLPADAARKSMLLVSILPNFSRVSLMAPVKPTAAIPAPDQAERLPSTIFPGFKVSPMLKFVGEQPARERTLATDWFGSTGNPQSGGQPVGGTDRFNRRAWSAEMTMHGQFGGNLHEVGERRLWAIWNYCQTSRGEIEPRSA